MAPPANRLISRLPRKAQSDLLARCEFVELGAAQVLRGRSAGSQYVYFPTDSVLSLWTSPEDTPAFEFAMVGNEGMLGAHVALGVAVSATAAHVQSEGSAWRMPAAQFKNELDLNAPLQLSTHRYLHVAMMQAVSMARCSRFHTLDQRLARWLLMMHDRVRQGDFTVTQESMAGMLGVRRVGVTLAATRLQRRGAIEYSRARVTILDRRSLAATACSCYAADVLCYSRFLS